MKTDTTEVKQNPPILSDFVLRLLKKRGIEEQDEIERFLKPDYERDTHDPLLLPDIEKAAERVLKAVSENQRIVIYSDYDTDGIPGAVVLHDFFDAIGYDNFRVYIPHRTIEGFGLNMKAIERFIDEDVDLIITIDCGIGDTEEIAQAQESGIDVIVTDHHLPVNGNPPAYAIVDPHIEGSEYPEKNLCGAAVVFKLVQVLLSHIQHTTYNIPASTKPTEEWAKWMLDMVGIATLSDMVPLVGENRVLATYGLRVLRQSRRPGLHALFAKTRVKQRDLSEEDVGFTIGPRINAASRMDVPHDAFALLSAKTMEEAELYASHLEKINRQRKGHVAAIVKNVKEHLGDEKPGLIVRGDPDWNPGLLGLVANTLANEYQCPVFLWGRGASEVIKGSCRTGSNIHLVDLMSAVPEDTFIGFGGHEFSGGFSLAYDTVHTLYDTITTALERVEATVPEASEIDEKLSLSEVTWDLFDKLSLLAPFGVGNTKPVFVLRDAYVKDISTFGSGDPHLKLILTDKKGNSHESISFFGARMKDDFVKGDPFRGMVHLEKSTFGYRSKLRFRLVEE